VPSLTKTPTFSAASFATAPPVRSKEQANCPAEPSERAAAGGLGPLSARAGRAASPAAGMSMPRAARLPAQRTDATNLQAESRLNRLSAQPARSLQSSSAARQAMQIMTGAAPSKAVGGREPLLLSAMAAATPPTDMVFKNLPSKKMFAPANQSIGNLIAGRLGTGQFTNRLRLDALKNTLSPALQGQAANILNWLDNLHAAVPAQHRVKVEGEIAIDITDGDFQAQLSKCASATNLEDAKRAAISLLRASPALEKVLTSAVATHQQLSGSVETVVDFLLTSCAAQKAVA
jgi:hypothetical protein